MEPFMVERGEGTNAASRFGWFTAGVLAVLIPIAIFFLAESLFRSAELDAATPPVIIEAP
jgi:hypothetical protein